MRLYTLAPVLLAVVALATPALSAPIPVASTPDLDLRASFDHELELRASQQGHTDFERRNFLTQLVPREDVFVRAFGERLQPRDLERRRIHIHIANSVKKFFHKLGHGIKAAAKKVFQIGKKIVSGAMKVLSKIPIPLPLRKREDASTTGEEEVLTVGKEIASDAMKVISKIPIIPIPIRKREDALILARDFSIDGELFSRGLGDDLELQPRERLLMRALVNALEARAVDDVHGRGMSYYKSRSLAR